MILPVAFAEEEEDDGWEMFWLEVSAGEEEDAGWMLEEDVGMEAEEEVGWTAEEEEEELWMRSVA